MSYAEERFRQIQDWAESTHLLVLVWGPAKSRKREEIAEALRDRFKKAEVFFSEDPDLRARLPPWLQGEAVPTQELAHLAACDVCVVLDESKGPGEEIAHFVNSRYASKLLILTHENYAGNDSFPDKIREPLRKYGNQQYYGEDEYKSCSLVARAIDRVRVVGFEKFSTEYA